MDGGREGGGKRRGFSYNEVRLVRLMVVMTCIHKHVQASFLFSLPIAYLWSSRDGSSFMGMGCADEGVLGVLGPTGVPATPG